MKTRWVNKERDFLLHKCHIERRGNREMKIIPFAFNLMVT